MQGNATDPARERSGYQGERDPRGNVKPVDGCHLRMLLLRIDRPWSSLPNASPKWTLEDEGCVPAGEATARH